MYDMRCQGPLVTRIERGTHLRSTRTSSIPLSAPPSMVARREDSTPSVGARCIHGTPLTPPPSPPPKPPPTAPPRSAIFLTSPAARFLETPPRWKLRRKRNRAIPTKGSRSSVIADVQDLGSKGKKNCGSCKRGEVGG